MMRKISLKNNNKGQSTLEYLIVLVIVIAIIFTFARVAFREAIEGSLNNLGDNIKNAASQF